MSNFDSDPPYLLELLIVYLYSLIPPFSDLLSPMEMVERVLGTVSSQIQSNGRRHRGCTDLHPGEQFLPISVSIFPSLDHLHLANCDSFIFA